MIGAMRPSHALLALLSILAAARPAAACSCAEVTPRAALEGHGAVFEGRVVTVERPDDPGGVTRVVLEVVQTWRGADAERVELTTPRESSMCGVPFEPRTSWLVYADVGAAGGLSTDLCQRTRRIEEASEDLAVLGAGVTPVDVTADDEVEPAAPTPAPTRAGCASCAIEPRDGRRGALGLLLFAAAAGAVRRANRRRFWHTRG